MEATPHSSPRAWLRWCVGALAISGVALAQDSRPIETLAPAHAATLRLSAYLTAKEVDNLDLTEAPFAAVTGKLRGLGVTRVFLEVYRGGFIVPTETLVAVRDEFRGAGFEVFGGIATVPGGEVGVRQEGPLGWFNWQHEKTQRDLAAIMRGVAPVFDHFIVDDFLCTGDVSAMSRQAKGDRTWSEYRRDLMTQVAEEALVKPAREANPDIHMIIKFPQWYDLFHEFGYDVERMPPLFDEVYIGTETRGARTQRYGFVQPYEGFVNYRWLSAIAGDKTGGAWFDHGDTADHDFVEQAFQTVLAGANEIVLFHFGALMEGHPDHPRLVEAYPALVELARAVDQTPVEGIVAYKPPHSDPGGDIYLMDFIGMLGIPLIPSPTFPADAKVMVLPTQAAQAPEIQDRLHHWLGAGRTLIMTAGFLSRAVAREDAGIRTFHQMAGLHLGPGTASPLQALAIGSQGDMTPLDHPLDLHGSLVADTAETVIEAIVAGTAHPFLTRHRSRGATVYVLNVYTFTQHDFDAVNEVLLSPRDLGLLYLPRQHATILRNALLEPLGIALDAPARVTFQPFGGRYMLYNYNEDAVTVGISRNGTKEIVVPRRGYSLGSFE